MKKSVLKVVVGTMSLVPLSLVVGFVPAPAGSLHKPSWVATPPIHIKGNATSTYQNGYAPSQIKSAYGVSQLSYTGAGETIAIVDAYGSPTIQSDLSTFDSQFGLPAANLTIAYPNGKANKTNGGWALETSLDVEWAHALAPDAKIMLVVAKSASTSDLINAINYATSHGAQVVSNSWGGSEFSSEASYDSDFQHTGVVYTASAGDSGAGVEWPAASPYVLSVGGTSLTINSNGSYGGETAWSSSGGGISSYESIPSYQSGYTGPVYGALSISALTGGERGIPDVSFDANPNTGVSVYDSTRYEGQAGWFTLGGTSVGAPDWAGILAAGRAAGATALQGDAAIYSGGYTTNLRDITSGTNGSCGTDCTAGAGYDLVTGLGSPINYP